MALPQPTRHIDELQSLRGLAALAVVLHHCTVYYAVDVSWRETAERFFNGRAAVVMFFVLSGFVLSASLMRNAPTIRNTARFYYRRFWRIYPALIVACAVGLAYWLLFKGAELPAIVSGWMSPRYRDPNASATELIKPFLGFGPQLPVAVWTISIELVGSMLVPLLVLLLLRARPAFFALSVVLALAALFIPPKLFGSTQYLVYFAFGASILVWGPQLGGLIRGKSTAAWVAAAAAIVLLAVQQIPDWLAGYESTAPTLAEFFEGVAATILVAIVAHRQDAMPFLRHRSFVFIGDISYSVYLLHLPIMMFVAGIGTEWLMVPWMADNPYVATVVLATLTLGLTIPAAWLCYKCVEVPGIAAGRKWQLSFLMQDKPADS